MPVFTDSMLLAEIVRRAHDVVADQSLLVPLTWMGNSHHHMDFPGTVSAEPRVYLDLLCNLVENFIAHGFRRILIINGHGGNDVPARQAIFEVRQRYRDRKDLLLLAATYWHLADPRSEQLGDRTSALADLQQNEMGHACEWETSMILRLAPELVDNHQNVAEVEFGNPFLPASRAWTMPDRSEPGHIGIPAAATAEKGEQLLQLFADSVAALIRRVSRWDGESWNG